MITIIEIFLVFVPSLFVGFIMGWTSRGIMERAEKVEIE